MWMEFLYRVCMLVLLLYALLSSPARKVVLLRKSPAATVNEEMGSHWLTAIHLFVGMLIMIGHLFLMTGIEESWDESAPTLEGLGLAFLATIGVKGYFALRPLLVRLSEKNERKEPEKGN